MNKIVLLRHGRTSYNAEHRLQGQIDIPLDEVGRWQAATAAEYLAKHLTGDITIVSSDLSRAVDTATEVARHFDVPVTTSPLFRERAFGPWEGYRVDEIAEEFPGQAEAWRSGGDPQVEGVETREQTAVRFGGAVREAATGLKPGGTLVVVAHGSAIALGLTELLGLGVDTWVGFRGIENAHWTVLTPNVMSPKPDWRVLGHNIGPNLVHPDWHLGPVMS